MDPNARLLEIRARMAEVDADVAKLLEERATLSKEVRGMGPSATLSEGEKDFGRFIDSLPEGALSKDALRAFFAQITSTARSIERPLRVAYAGTEGGFCHQMTKAHFGLGAAFVECATVTDALEEVRRERAAFCTFPFDSSVDGLILPAIFALAETDLVLVAERIAPAMLCLMGQSPRGDGPIERIVASSTAHAASERFRKREFPGAIVLDVRSAMEAARAAHADARTLAVIPEAAGRELGLTVLRENVGDEPELRYRYGIVGSRPASRSGADTTCLLFSLDDAPGTLFQVLGHFAERGINLKKIQSRPVRGASWDYIFYVEVAGHITDRAVVTALESVKGSTKYLKLLGSFKTES